MKLMINDSGSLTLDPNPNPEFSLDIITLPRQIDLRLGNFRGS